MAQRTAIVKATSNADFGRRVGIHYTFASRIRNGKRLPSLDTISAIQTEFNLNDKETSDMIHAAAAGPQAFGDWINEHLFEESVSPERASQDA